MKKDLVESSDESYEPEGQEKREKRKERSFRMSFSKIEVLKEGRQFDSTELKLNSPSWMDGQSR